MSELKVNKIEPVAGNEIFVEAQVLGVPGTKPNHFATVSQLPQVLSGGRSISAEEAETLVSIGISAAQQLAQEYSDVNDAQQTEQLTDYVNTQFGSVFDQVRDYTDSIINRGIIQKKSATINALGLGSDPTQFSNGIGLKYHPTGHYYGLEVQIKPQSSDSKIFVTVTGQLTYGNTNLGDTSVYVKIGRGYLKDFRTCPQGSNPIDCAQCEACVDAPFGSPGCNDPVFLRRCDTDCDCILETVGTPTSPTGYACWGVTGVTEDPSYCNESCDYSYKFMSVGLTPGQEGFSGPYLVGEHKVSLTGASGHTTSSSSQICISGYDLARLPIGDELGTGGDNYPFVYDHGSCEIVKYALLIPTKLNPDRSSIFNPNGTRFQHATITVEEILD